MLENIIVLLETTLFDVDNPPADDFIAQTARFVTAA